MSHGQGMRLDPRLDITISFSCGDIAAYTSTKWKYLKKGFQRLVSFNCALNAMPSHNYISVLRSAW